VSNPQHPPLLHIGFPKCASTWLQRHLFVRAHGFATVFNPAAAKAAFIDQHPGAQPVAPLWQARRSAVCPPGLVPVCTCEQLSGTFTRGAPDSLAIAGRLHAALPEARVLIAVREQRSMLLSLYKTLIAWGSARSISALLEPPEPGYGSWVDYLRYDRLHAHYTTLFGAERVKVISYEGFVANPGAVLDDIKAFAGIRGPRRRRADYPVRERANESADLLTLEAVRLVNRLVRTEFNDRGWLRDSTRLHKFRILASNRHSPLLEQLNRPLRRRFERQLAERTRGLFEAGNRRLAAATGLDLAAQ
jgi:hypothetical protein